jgi:uncharacterized protein involved in exopolysaccharide biosynthesis
MTASSSTDLLTAQDEPRAASPDIVRALLQRKWIVLIAIIVGAGVGVVAAALTNRAWRSEVILVIAKSDEESGGLSGLGNELGGISALAGISLPTDAARTEYLATLKSNGLVRNFLLQGTAAVDFCRPKIIECPDPATWKGGPPEVTLYRMARKFQRSVLNVEEDKITGLIKVSVTWIDPVIASQWANGIVALANKHLQERAEDEARRRVNYLSDAVQKTDLVPLRDAVSRLMEGQVKTEMLAETRPDYAFRVVDAARPSARYDSVKPQWAIMIAGGAVLGFLAIAVWTIAWPPRPRQI